MSSTSKLKYLSCVVLTIGIAFYITYPLLKGEYGCFDGEYEIRQSFLMNFIETLKQGELPVWNEYVGGGHPAMYFGHYPITQNTIFYMLFGVKDWTYNFMRFFNLFVLLVSFVYAGRLLKLGYLASLIGALIYFSVNFISKWIVVDTIGNLVLVYPLLIVLVFKIIKERQWKTILIFNLVYIFWLTGGHIVYVYMHLIMLSLIYWISVYSVYLEPSKLKIMKRFAALYFVLFIIPMLAVLYQYYFVYDVIKASNRIKDGLIVSPFDPIVWKQLWRSFQSSSYFWLGLLLIPLSWIRKSFKIPRNALIIVIGMLLYLTVIDMQFSSTSRFFADYIQLLNSSDFRVAILLYLILPMVIFKGHASPVMQVRAGGLVIFTVCISLLSYYFYSPGNIIKMDYDLFMELSIFTRIIFVLGILFSAGSYRNNKMVKVSIISLVVLYLIRSHLIIPLMRFTGIIWYPVNDSPIFSALFAILFIFGLKNMIELFPHSIKIAVFRSNNLVHAFRYVLLLALLVLLVQDSFDKFYKGRTNQLLLPKKRELVDPSQMYIINYHEEIPALTSHLLYLNKNKEHFYRIFTSKNYFYMPGILQDYKIHEASIYDSSITNDVKDFFEHTILRQPLPDRKDVKNVLPHRAFPKHTLDGFGVTSFEAIPYRDVYLIDDAQYLKNQNIEFFWDIMQVKYLVIRADFVRAIETFSGRGNYKLLGPYPGLDIYLYEIVKDKQYSRLGILPLDSEQDFNEVMGKINSEDVNALKQVYKKIVYPDGDTKDFTLLKSQTGRSRRYYEIDAKQKGILIEFESWNRHWGLKVNKEKKKLYKAFTIFRGTRIEPGKNIIEMKYNVPYFKGLFIVSVLTILTYMVLFVYAAKRKPLAKL